MINKKKMFLMSRIGLFVLVLFIIIAIVPFTISKYETVADADISSNIAFYLFHDDYL